MALKLRRGTNAERTAITPVAGELVYTTDTKKVWVGDGSTVGGNIVTGQNDIVDDTTPQLGGNLDLNGNNITGTGNINITGTVTASGNINLGDGAGGDVIAVGGVVQGALIPDVSVAYNQGANTARWNTGFFSSLDVLGHIQADSIQGDLIADDSTVSWNQTTNQFSGTFVGTLQGDVSGSLFADDSSLLVDAVNSKIVGNYQNGTSIINSSSITATSITSEVSQFHRTGAVPILGTKRIESSTIAGTASLARITTSYNEGSGDKVVWTTETSKDYMNFFPNPGGGSPDYTKFVQVWNNGKLQVCGEAGASGFAGMTREPVAQLEVNGDAVISGVIDAASFRGSLVADDSTTIVDAINSTITVGSFVQFGSMTTAQRNALTAANGMVIYNTTLNKFQGYENGGWASLI